MSKLSHMDYKEDKSPFEKTDWWLCCYYFLLGLRLWETLSHWLIFMAIFILYAEESQVIGIVKVNYKLFTLTWINWFFFFAHLGAAVGVYYHLLNWHGKLVRKSTFTLLLALFLVSANSWTKYLNGFSMLPGVRQLVANFVFLTLKAPCGVFFSATHHVNCVYSIVVKQTYCKHFLPYKTFAKEFCKHESHICWLSVFFLAFAAAFLHSWHVTAILCFVPRVCHCTCATRDTHIKTLLHSTASGHTLNRVHLSAGQVMYSVGC